MRRQEGYLLIFDACAEAPLERDTVQCRHCQRIVEVKPGTNAHVYLEPDGRAPSGYREEAGAFCGSCYGPICLGCEVRERRGDPCERGSHFWERTMERDELAARRRRGMTG